MSVTVRTSITDRPSSDWIDDLSNERKWERLDDPPFVLDENSTVVRREHGHDVLPFQFSSDEVRGAVELDPSVAVNLPNPRDMTLGEGKSQMTAGIDVGLEREAVGQMAEDRPETVTKDPGKPSTVFGGGKSSAGLLNVVVAKEAIARSAHRPQIGADVKKDAFLPEAVEALDGGVPPRFARRNEQEVNAQEEMQPHDLGQAVTIPAPSGGRHLVVHLGDLRQAHKAPGINKMAAERDRLFVGELAGRSRLSDDIDGVEGIEASDAARSPQISRPDQVGLLEVAHPAGEEIGIRGPAGQSADFDLFRLPSPGQDLFDGRDRGKETEAPSLELEMDRFRAEPRKSRPPALVSRQFIAQGQNFSDQRRRCLAGNPFRRSDLVPKPSGSHFPKATEPFGHPEAAPMDGPDDLHKSHPVLIEFNGFLSSLVFALDAHGKNLLPADMGKSLCAEQIAYRCLYGFSLSDVLTETP